MENSNSQNCPAIAHFCTAGIEAPKSAVQPEINRFAERFAPLKNKTNQKPWSVFGDVFWI